MQEPLMRQSFIIEMEPDRVIRGDLFPSKKRALGTIIICHGYKGFKDWGMFPYVGEQLSDSFDVITFNFSHNGVGEQLVEFTELEKFAKNTYSRELEDLFEVVDRVRHQTLPIESQAKPGPIFLLGHSRGAGVCFIHSFDHPDTVNGVISWNGITNVDLFSDEEKNEMRTKGRAYVYNARTKQNMPLDVEILEDMEKNKERFNILERVKSAKVPIVIIQGTEDFQRLQIGSEAMMAANPAVKRILITGGNHTFNAVHPFAGTTEPLEAAIHHTREWVMRQIHDDRNQRYHIQ